MNREASQPGSMPVDTRNLQPSAPNVTLPPAVPSKAPWAAVEVVSARPRLESWDADEPKLNNAFSVVPNPLPLGAFTDERKLESAFRPSFVATFDEPCHFPYTGRGLCHEPICRDALVIYEGMRLAVAADGRYEVSFVAESPRLPVVLRLQLLLLESEVGRDVARGTITLAPIVLQAETNLDRHQPSQSQHVRRVGYSHLLRQLRLGELPQTHPNYSIRRTGVARFGSIPEQAVYSPVTSDSDSAP